MSNLISRHQSLRKDLERPISVLDRSDVTREQVQAIADYARACIRTWMIDLVYLAGKDHWDELDLSEQLKRESEAFYIKEKVSQISLRERLINLSILLEVEDNE